MWSGRRGSNPLRFAREAHQARLPTEQSNRYGVALNAGIQDDCANFAIASRTCSKSSLTPIDQHQTNRPTSTLKTSFLTHVEGLYWAEINCAQFWHNAGIMCTKTFLIFWAALAISFVLVVVLAGCSNQAGTANSDNETQEKITNDGGIYSIGDFNNTGFKVVKEYDVSELENSSGAWFGFWKNDSNTSIVFDYEIRTYPSHQLALDSGVEYVEEVIGEDAILSKSLSSWKEGIQDRRTRSGRGMSGSESNTIRAKYLDYIVFGNTLILCEGLDLKDARKNCSDLVNTLGK